MSFIRNSLQFSVALLTVAVAFPQDVIQPGQPPRGVMPEPATAAGNSYIVTFASGTQKNARALAAMSAGAAVRFNYDGVDAMAVTVPNENALNALRRNPQVQRVLPDYVIKGRPKPPGNGGGGGATTFQLDRQQLVSYEVQRVGIPDAGNDGTGIGIALLDTGIDFAHPDLKPAANTSATSFNAVTPGGSCQDDGGHGTHVAGLMAAQNNTIGIVGVAPAATVYCVKVLSSAITGTDSQIMAGLDWVLQNYNRVTPRIRVVNMSLGRTLASGETLENSPLRPLLDALYARGVVVVAAAGNNPNYEITQMVPAGFPSVISVSSTVATNGIRACLLFGMDLQAVKADAASGFTTDGAGVTVAAPGEERTDIVNMSSLGCVGLEYGTLSTTLNTAGVTRKLVPSLTEARGTSFAAPLVAGAVARVMQKGLVAATFNGAEVEAIRTWLRNNASRRGTAPLDHPWGGVVYPVTPDGVREGIVQAPQ